MLNYVHVNSGSKGFLIFVCTNANDGLLANFIHTSPTSLTPDSGKPEVKESQSHTWPVPSNNLITGFNSIRSDSSPYLNSHVNNFPCEILEKKFPFVPMFKIKFSQRHTTHNKVITKMGFRRGTSWNRFDTLFIHFFRLKNTP